jgi:hypothetical protein
MSDVQSFHDYHAWLVITSLFLVSVIFLHLAWMLKPLSIATTIDIEHIFSCGHLVLPYVRNHLAIQSTRTSLCVRLWSSQGLVKDTDIKASLGADEILGEEGELAKDWDAIPLNPL